MRGKDELLRAEEDAWGEIHELLHQLTPEQASEPGFIDNWTAKDLLAHLSCWHAEAATVLCQLRLGTFAGWDEDVEETNRRFYEATRDLSYDDVVAQLHAARFRMLEEMDRLPEDKLTLKADEWFRESGAEHYRNHLPGLRAWLERLRGSTA